MADDGVTAADQSFGMAATIDARILGVAARSAGVCTRAELVAVGVPTRTITARVAAGALARIGPGLYEVPALVTADTPLFRAARAHPDGAISHRTAARLWGFALPPPAIDEPVEVTVPRPGGSRPRVPGVRVHATRRWSPADWPR